MTGPWRITFDTNPDMCNLKCIMCEEHSTYRTTPKQKRIMDPEIIKKVIASASGNGLKEVIPSTMGEPLLYPHFDEFIELSQKHGFKLNITTNGTFPKRGAKEWGELLLPHISDMKISINGSTKATNESIMQGISHEEIIENVKTIVRIRDRIREQGINHPTVTFQVTYLKSNLEELPELLERAIDLDIDRFKGHHLWVTWPELENESLTRDRDSRELWNQTVSELKEIAKNSPKDNLIKLDNVYPLELDSEGILPTDWDCPFLEKEAWIAWDGTFNVCCSPNEKRSTLGQFGNVTETGFMELWESDRYRSHTANWGNHKVCRECSMRRPPEEVCE